MSRSPFIGSLGFGNFPTSLGGPLTITPASGTGLTINQLSGSLGIVTQAAAGNLASIGIAGNGSVYGVSSFDLIMNQSGNAKIINRGTGDLTMGCNGVNNMLSFATTGAITLLAPTAGVNLTLNAVAGSAALVSNGSAYTPSNNIGNSGTAFTVDCSKSNVHYVTMTGNVAAGSMTISNLAEGQTINLHVTNGAGPFTLGNATGVKWPGGTIGALTASNGALDVITISKFNGNILAAITKGFA